MATSIRVTDFRPVAMGNFFYKIFTKVIATRLGTFLGEILSPSQYGFVPGSNIRTCIALAFETINSLQMGLIGNIALKVDITKAFDMVLWDFLEFVLKCMHFSPRFIIMVRNILRSAMLSILINDSSHGFFSCSRGVWQGDPLSPLLFCLAKEALIRWIDHSIDSGELTVHRKLPHHLLYAVDVMIFVEATHSNGRRITNILKDYCNLSGWKFNASKSSVFFSSSATTQFKWYIMRCTSISADSLPFTYLGVPIFHRAPKVEYLTPIADQILNKFNVVWSYFISCR